MLERAFGRSAIGHYDAAQGPFGQPEQTSPPGRGPDVTKPKAFQKTLIASQRWRYEPIAEAKKDRLQERGSRSLTKFRSYSFFCRIGTMTRSNFGRIYCGRLLIACGCSLMRSSRGKAALMPPLSQITGYRLISDRKTPYLGRTATIVMRSNRHGTGVTARKESDHDRCGPTH
jgi:hypothetical protein